MSKDFKLFLLDPSFHSICDWSAYKIPVKSNRPVILLTIEDKTYPNCLCCIPISKDDDKNGKYKNLSRKKPDLVHSIDVNEYDNYLLIQNMFYIRKEFIGSPFLVNNVHSEIKKKHEQKEIIKKTKKINALIKTGKLNFVDRETVHNIQINYLDTLKTK